MKWWTDSSKELLTELRIIFDFNRTGARKERFEKWQEHVKKFATIKCGEQPWGATRIDFTAGHLDILDRKFAFLLTFQALLSGIITLAVNALKPESFYQAGKLGIWLLVLLAIGFILWVINTLLCLSGVRRVTWGDLWKNDATEETHVEALLIEVVKRTAKFRVAVSLTVGSVLLITVLAILAGRVAYQSLLAGQKSHSAATCAPCPAPPACPQASAPSENKFEITNPLVHVNGHLHSHTFLLNKQTGEIWEMTCKKGKTVEFRPVEVVERAVQGSMSIR
jgi:hypothetical protein